MTSVIFSRLSECHRVWFAQSRDRNLTKGVRIVTLVTKKENGRVVSHATIPAEHSRTREDCQKKKLSPKEAAQQLAKLVEQNMVRKGLSEQEKNFRVGRFAAFVDSIKRSRRKS